MSAPTEQTATKTTPALCKDVSTPVFMDTRNLCGYCMKYYRISGIYAHFYTCKQNNDKSADQKKKCAASQKKIQAKYSGNPITQQARYLSGLKKEAKKEIKMHDKRNQFASLSKTHYFYWDGNDEACNKIVHASEFLPKYRMILYNLLGEVSYDEKAPKTITYYENCYKVLSEHNLDKTYPLLCKTDMDKVRIIIIFVNIYYVIEID